MKRIKTIKIIAIAALFVSSFFFVDLSYAKENIQTCGSFSVQIKSNSTVFVPTPSVPSIFDIKIVHASAKDSCVVISWKTDKPATSQVVYGLLSDNTSINATKKNLGYLQATSQNNSGDTIHYAIVKNIKPNKTYKFQAVSKSYPNGVASVSAPIKFVMHVATTKTNTQTNPAIKKQITKPIKSVQKPVPTKPTVTKPNKVIKSLGKPASTYAHKKPVEQALKQNSNTPAASIIKPQVNVKESKQANFAQEKTQINIDVVQKYPEISALSLFNNAKKAIEQKNKEIIEKAKKLPAEKIASIPEMDKEKAKVMDKIMQVFDTFSFVLPTIILIGLLYFAQRWLLPGLGIVVENPKLFWVSSILTFAVISLVFAWFKVAFALFAIVAIILAWYSLDSLVETEEEGDKDKTNKTTGYTLFNVKESSAEDTSNSHSNNSTDKTN